MSEQFNEEAVSGSFSPWRGRIVERKVKKDGFTFSK